MTTWISPEDATAICAINRRVTTILTHLARWHDRGADTSGMSPRQAADDALAEIEHLHSDLDELRERVAAEAQDFDATLDARIASVWGIDE